MQQILVIHVWAMCTMATDLCQESVSEAQGWQGYVAVKR